MKNYKEFVNEGNSSEVKYTSKSKWDAEVKRLLKKYPERMEFDSKNNVIHDSDTGEIYAMWNDRGKYVSKARPNE